MPVPVFLFLVANMPKSSPWQSFPTVAVNELLIDSQTIPSHVISTAIVGIGSNLMQKPGPRACLRRNGCRGYQCCVKEVLKDVLANKCYSHHVLVFLSVFLDSQAQGMYPCPVARYLSAMAAAGRDGNASLQEHMPSPTCAGTPSSSRTCTRSRVSISHMNLEIRLDDRCFGW